MMARPAVRFGVALAVLYGATLLLIGTVFLSLALDMEDARRASFGRMLLQHAAQLAALAVLLLAALGWALKLLFERHFVPLARLAEDVVLLLANPAHRAGAHGAPALRLLADKINALGAAHHALRADVQERIAGASHALNEEKDRLAALMSELAHGVLVCNIEGRILLCNAGARQLLEGGQEGAIGLGRSVFGVLERGLIVHALEQIQYQAEQPGRAGRPLASFVASLSGGLLLRVRMAPVFDRAHALNGFVLTLEDVSGSVLAESRRDALLQALTQDSRARLGNIRAAVEMLQGFPAMSDAKKAQFAGIIDAESQRLATQIERALQEDLAHPSARLEDMRGADLIALLRRRLDAGPPPEDSADGIDGTLWLKVDSYALAQALAGLAQRLRGAMQVPALDFALQRAGTLASLDLVWSGPALAADTLRLWENAALPGAAGLTLRAAIAGQGGAAVYLFDRERGTSRYRVLLPLAAAQAALKMAPKGKGRPEFYDFDLFHQPGQNGQLDRGLLAQLDYTVFDTETTGLRPADGDEIIAIGALRIVNGRLLQHEHFEQLVQPGCALSAESTAIHGIDAAMLDGQPPIATVLPRFFRFAADTVLVAHNAAFDMRFLQMKEERTGIRFTQPVLDTLLLSQVIHPQQLQHTLEAIALRLGVPIVGRHTALGDAIVTGEVFLKMLPLLAEKGILTLKDARDAEQQTPYARLRY